MRRWEVENVIPGVLSENNQKVNFFFVNGGGGNLSTET